MRRATGIFLGALLVIAAGYAGYWFIAAGRIEDGAVTWAHAQRADKVDISWQKLRVVGFPAHFRIELEAATLRDNALAPSPEFRIPVVSGTARPWDFATWQLTAPDGFTADIAGSDKRAAASLAVQSADGVIAIGQDGGWKLWLKAREASLEAVSRVRVSSADAWVIAPPKVPRRNTEPRLALAVSARQLELPAGIEPLGNAIDEFDFSATAKGGIAAGRLPAALAAWRDAGGTIELDNLHVKWGGLDATASGSVAIDQELQPVGALSGSIAGYDQILTALVGRGLIRAADAGLARIALSMLARPGPDGKPEISTAFTIQNGHMFLGPAKLGKAPRLTWE